MKFLSIFTAIAMLFLSIQNLSAEETTSSATESNNSEPELYTEKDLTCNTDMTVCKDKKGVPITSAIVSTDKKTKKLYLKVYDNGTLRAEIKYHDESKKLIDYNTEDAFMMTLDIFHLNGKLGMHSDAERESSEGTTTIYTEDGKKSFEMTVKRVAEDTVDITGVCYFKNGKTREATDDEVKIALEGLGEVYTYSVKSPCEEIEKK